MVSETNFFGRPLPMALEAERMILGSLIARSLPVEMVTAVLDKGDFALEKHRRIFNSIVELSARGDAVNGVTVPDNLIGKKELESVGGLSYLIDLGTDSVPVNLDSYLRLVKDRAVLRNAIRVCAGVIDRCYQAQDEATEIVFEAESVLAKLGDVAQAKIRLRKPTEIIEGHPGGANAFFYPHKQRSGIPTPWPSVDETLGGFRPGKLIVIAARTGVGKSVAAAQIAQWTAQLGNGTAVFSMEMGADEILIRMICSRASVNSFKFQTGYLSREERIEFQKAATEISKLPVWIDDSTACTVPAIHSAVRKLKATHGVGIVIIDYLGLLEASGRAENRVQEVSALTRGLKRAAREFRIPFVVLSQLSRQAAGKDAGEPELHHLRESGSIEQDADVVLFIHPLGGKPADGAPPLAVEDCRFILAKHRGGPVGRCTLQLMRHFTRFDDPKGIPNEPDRLWDDDQRA